MIVSPSAVESFLSRDLRDCSTIKKRSKKELLRRVNKLRPKPVFKTKLYKHQLATFLLCARYPGFGVWLDMGGGKTATMLALAAWRIARGDTNRVMVLVPLSSNVQEWGDQIEEHSDLSYALLDGASRQSRISGLESDAQICVITYAGFLALVSTKVTKYVWKKGKRTKVTEMQPDKKLCRMLGREFGMWICDESTFLRNQEAKTWRALNHIFKFATFRYLLTGTPYGTDPQELWPQFRLMDGGETLGKTLGLFRAAFCTEQEMKFGKKAKKFVQYKFDKRKTRRLRRMTRALSLRYRDSEMTELPQLLGGIVSKKGPMVRRVEFSKEIQSYYQRLIEELEEARGSFSLVDNAFIRMRCLTSGYLAVVDPEGERIQVKFKDNPKLDALVGLLREVDPERKVIVACVYKATGAILMERLQKEKMAPVRIYSGTSTAQRKKVLEKFRKGSSRVLVASEAVAFGMNLQAASVIVVYESPVSPITRRQFEKRIHRHGQKRRCLIYDLVVKGSIDEKILGALKSGRDLYRELIEGGQF